MENKTNLDMNMYLHGHPQITLLKSTYQQITQCYSKKTKYQTVNNIEHESTQYIHIEPNDFLSTIQRMCITNASNIKQLGIFIVNNNINIEDLTIDSQPDTDQIQIICKISSTYLKVFTSLFSRVQNDKFLIPIVKNALVPKLLVNQKFMIIIDCVDQMIKSDLSVTYGIVVSPIEIHKYNNIDFETLFKRQFTKSHIIEIGENIINTDIYNMSISDIIITSNNNIDITLQNNLINQKIYNIKDDDEFILHNDIEHLNIYIYDALNNLVENIDKYNNFQPTGSIVLHQDGKFIINSTVKTTVDITYAVFDVLRTNNNIHNTYIVSQYAIVVQPLEPIIFVPQDLEPIILVPQPQIKINKKLYDNLYEKFFEKYEKDNAIKKWLGNDDKICIISQESINLNDYYYECVRCKQCAKPIELKLWLSVSRKQECPVCRKSGDSLPQLYVNHKSMLHKLMSYVGSVASNCSNFIKNKIE